MEAAVRGSAAGSGSDSDCSECSGGAVGRAAAGAKASGPQLDSVVASFEPLPDASESVFSARESRTDLAKADTLAHVFYKEG